MISYDGLLQTFSERGMTKSSLTGKLGISSRTVARIARGEKIAKMFEIASLQSGKTI